MKTIQDILFSGAKNSTIARSLNEAGFYYPVFGHDTVNNGIYICSEEDGWNLGRHCSGKPMDLIHESEYISDFWYLQKVSTSDIPTLKEIYL